MNYYTLKHGDYTAVINLDRGANCISLRHKNLDKGILREPNFNAKTLDNPYLYGTPILFPVNRIENGTFIFNDEEYTFTINEEKTNCHLHGYLHEKPFSLISKTESSIVCEYSEKSRKGFPHDFKIIIKYDLSVEGLTQTVTVKNLSNKVMPCMLGFHTTFNLNKGDRVYAGVKKEIYRNMDNYLPTGEILPLDSVGKDLLAGTFTPKFLSKHYLACNNNAFIYNRDKNYKIVYEYDEKYLYRLIYGTEEFICLEPQNCVVNAPNLLGELKNSGVTKIKPNSEEKFICKIFVKEK